MINARSENILDKPAFREAFQNRRCLVPADGFYEWKRTGRSKQPIHISMQDDSLFAFAGIWDRWKDAGGKAIETCSILTTTPNSLLAKVHDRCRSFSNRRITICGLIRDLRTSIPSPGC
jgi:putative SOS response-associated peptidase YedK